MTRAPARLGHHVGVALLVAWAAWWVHALVSMRLAFAEHTWLTFPVLGSDFWSQSELAARAYLAGKDPYVHNGGTHLVHYPPLAVRMFVWVHPLSTAVAFRVWIVVIAATIVSATVVAHRTRERIGAEPIPFTLALASVLFGFPVLFEMERANCNVLVLTAVLAALPLLRRASPRGDLAAGAVLALTPWIKVFPGLLVAALGALRRPRAAVAFLVVALAIGLATPRETLYTLDVLERAVRFVEDMALEERRYWPWTHSLSLAYTVATRDTALGALPGTAVALAAVGAAITPVYLRVRASPNRDALAYPLMLWVVGAASFVPVIANDYSLIFVSIAGVCTVGRRDPEWVRWALAAGVVAWQPIAFPAPPLLLLALKIAGTAAVGGSLVARAADARPRATFSPASP